MTGLGSCVVVTCRSVLSETEAQTTVIFGQNIFV
jgi:hypothetical protein